MALSQGFHLAVKLALSGKNLLGVGVGEYGFNCFCSVMVSFAIWSHQALWNNNKLSILPHTVNNWVSYGGSNWEKWLKHFQNLQSIYCHFGDPCSLSALECFLKQLVSLAIELWQAFCFNFFFFFRNLEGRRVKMSEKTIWIWFTSKHLMVFNYKSSNFSFYLYIRKIGAQFRN